MSIVRMVERAERVAWDTISPFTIPIGILRTKTGSTGFDPNTMEPLPASSELKISKGVMTNYSSEELNSLGDELEIGVDSRKIIFQMNGFTPLVGDHVLLWTPSSFQNFKVSLLSPPTNFPPSSSKEVWICDKVGLIGDGLSVSQGSLLHSPLGSVGGTFIEVGVDWQLYSPSAQGNIINSRKFDNLGLSMIVLDIKLTG